ncbi:glutaredoxin family protein [Allonocardiopsis opalescens]|uniref:Glutaredoxin n=1 Tax=Allonocardiopsis opalescens TaxID=1144618 RepID=A0A2T0Q7T4_9ACTN|nr:glutaredoxin family protein [Allonocardiopsis opalescens]PRX99879.1 glutaredoxin [Allonocardiopsis opalescens]
MTGHDGRAAPRIALLGKPGCHLCDDARRVVAEVAAELGVAWTERDLTEAPQRERDEYWDKIPVVFVDGRPHDFWRVEPERLRRALAAGR